MGHRNAITVSTWTALIAGAGWLLSGALYGALTYFNSVVPASLVRLVFPETIPANAWHTPMPWPVVLPVVSTLTLAGLAAVSVKVALPGPGERARPVPVLLAVWFAVVLASFFAQGLWAAGTVLAGWPPPRLAFMLNGVESSLLSAGYSGIVWGWVPALLAVRRVRTGRPTAPSAPEGGKWIMATAFLAAALVAAVPLSAAATKARLPAAAPPQPSEPPVVYGSPGVSAATEDAGTDWCAGGQVEITLGQPDAATGHRAVDLRLQNVGTKACVLAAYPDIAFDDEDGWAMEVFVFRGGTFMTDDPGRQPITLAPEETARASLGWNAMAAAGDKRAGTILVAPYAGTVRTSLPADLDIVNGGAAAVTAWAADAG